MKKICNRKSQTNKKSIYRIPLGKNSNFGRKIKIYIMELKNIEILLDKVLKVIKRVENILEKLENRMLNIEINKTLL